MFYGPLKEADTVEIVDSNASAFKEFLQFLYLPKVSLSIGNIDEVARLADKYDIDGFEVCAKFLSEIVLTMENIAEVTCLANKYNMIDCVNVCIEFLEKHLTHEHLLFGYQLAISLENEHLKAFCATRIQIIIDVLLESESFITCDREVLEHILRLDTLECDEINLFNACIEWAKAACHKNGIDAFNSENLKNQLGPCFNLIRFGAMEGEQIAEILANKVYDGLFARDEFADIMQAKWNKHYKSELFNHQPRSSIALKSNENEALVCQREIAIGQSLYRIQNVENVWFSTNQPILLTKISFNYHYNKGHGLIISDLSLAESKTKTFAADTALKVLERVSCITISGHLQFNSPVLIKPYRLYNIRMDIKSRLYSHCHYSSWATQVKLNEKIDITFHQNPADANSARRGFVSKLYFNQI